MKTSFSIIEAPGFLLFNLKFCKKVGICFLLQRPHVEEDIIELKFVCFVGYKVAAIYVFIG